MEEKIKLIASCNITHQLLSYLESLVEKEELAAGRRYISRASYKRVDNSGRTNPVRRLIISRLSELVDECMAEVDIQADNLR